MKTTLQFLTKRNKQKYQKYNTSPHAQGDKFENSSVTYKDDDIETDDISTSQRTEHPKTLDLVFENNQTPALFFVPDRSTLENQIPAKEYSSLTRDKDTAAITPSLILSDLTNPNIQSDLHNRSVLCSKNPGHKQFIPIIEINTNHFPESFREEKWVRLIKLKAVDVVCLIVSVTSAKRPDELGFKDVKETRHGTGTAFLYHMDKTELCDCRYEEAGHSVSGLFRVMTVAHVVFDDEEARNTTVEFFYDSADTSTIVRGWGVRVCHVDVDKNISIIECRTHNLNLCQQLTNAQKERNSLIANELETQTVSAQMTVIISHPHGMCKQITFGDLMEKKVFGDTRTTKEGATLINCILKYNTPTCTGTGGAPVNVIGGGTTCYAFAPHCASMGSDENISGMGWARVIPGM